MEVCNKMVLWGMMSYMFIVWRKSMVLLGCMGWMSIRMWIFKGMRYWGNWMLRCILCRIGFSIFWKCDLLSCGFWMFVFSDGWVVKVYYDLLKFGILGFWIVIISVILVWYLWNWCLVLVFWLKVFFLCVIDWIYFLVGLCVWN